MDFDKDVIEASFAMQYGIRLSKEDIGFGEFLRLLSGIMPETPLGRLVAVRSEDRTDVLKGFGVYEKKVRSEWRNWSGELRVESEELVGLQEELARMFG